MKQSALFLALILIGTNQPAHGSQLVVAEEDVAASAGNEPLPQETPAVEGPVAGPLAAETDDSTSEAADQAANNEKREFDRLFGAKPETKQSAQEQAIVQQSSGAAMPWWAWPMGMFAMGALLMVRSRMYNKELPTKAIRIVSRQHLGKEGALALIELSDGDARTRRLLVGLGGGAPRLVADVSAWEVAVAAPSNVMNDAVASAGPDPDQASVTQLTDRRVVAQPVSAEREAPALRLASKGFGAELARAAKRYGEVEDATVSSSGRADLIEDVLAKRERIRRESVGDKASKKSYSSREILA